jgi:uncharacterized protein (DUF488 family)
MSDGESLRVYTAGHSNKPVEALLDLLLGAGIEILADVRQFPASRRNPQFNRGALEKSLGEHGIEYRHFRDLGGRRAPQPDSRNSGLRNEAFRGYADYMQTPAFEGAIEELLEVAKDKRTAVMCAEALPWRCHRSLLADALAARGVAVVHLMHGGNARVHELSPGARVEDGHVSYPALL